MDDSIKYSFSIAYGLRSLIALAFIILSFPPFNTHWKAYQQIDIVLVLIFDLMIFLLLLVSVIKFVIPSIRSDVALEISTTGIKYFKRSRNINWENVHDIRFCAGRYSDFLAIDLIDKKKYTSQFKNPLKIFLMWCSNISNGTPLIIEIAPVKGKNESIYNVTKQYLTNHKNEKQIQNI